jgi:hypothetical protein
MPFLIGFIGILCSVIVHDFDIECIAGLEPKADPPLIIDTDAEIATSVASQGLKPIVGWYPQIIKSGCTVEHLQFALSNGPNVDPASDILPREDRRGGSASERLDHCANYISRLVKR